MDKAILSKLNRVGTFALSSMLLAQPVLTPLSVLASDVNSVTSNTRQEVRVTAEVAGGWTVTIPKAVNLTSDKSGSGEYKASVPVSVSGDIAVGKVITVETDETLALKDANNNTRVAIVELDETEFDSDELREAGRDGLFASHLIKANLTPGEWSGTQEFRINLKDVTPVAPVEKITFFIETLECEAEKDQTLADWITANPELGYKLEGNNSQVVNADGNPLVTSSDHLFVYGNEVIDSGEHFRETFEFELNLYGYTIPDGPFYAVEGMTLMDWSESVLGQGTYIPTEGGGTCVDIWGWDANGNSIGDFYSPYDVEIHEGYRIYVDVYEEPSSTNFYITFDNYNYDYNETGITSSISTYIDHYPYDGNSASLDTLLISTGQRDLEVDYYYDDFGRKLIKTESGLLISGEPMPITDNILSITTADQTLNSNGYCEYTLYYIMELHVQAWGETKYVYAPLGTTYGELQNALYSYGDIQGLAGRENEYINRQDTIWFNMR